MKYRPRVEVRALRPGEGAAVASLWRELWDAHEHWGGYPGSRDARVYAQVAEKLNQDARVRAGHPLLGRHVHFVATVDGVPCGQVEGWLDRLGASSFSPLTCEVRSLVVGAAARGKGAGRALLTGLATVAKEAANGASCVLAAEVLEPNPARHFYDRVGYAAVSWTSRIETATGAVAPSLSRVSSRMATPDDALAIARLEASLAERRVAAGDVRFDRPGAVDATIVGAIAAHVAATCSPSARFSMRDPATLVAVDPSGAVRAAASCAIQALEPPFLPIRRALIGRFALDPAVPARPLLQALTTFGCRWAASSGAHYAELTDLSAPGTEIHEAALAFGARPWSRVVVRSAPA